MSEEGARRLDDGIGVGGRGGQSERSRSGWENGWTLMLLRVIHVVQQRVIIFIRVVGNLLLGIIILLRRGGV